MGRWVFGAYRFPAHPVHQVRGKLVFGGCAWDDWDSREVGEQVAAVYTDVLVCKPKVRNGV
jgi:hypothetical protein